MQGFKIPKQLATGLFTDIIVPSVGQNGYGAIWNNSTKKIEWAQFETLGAVASGIATHVALSNPHSQYPLSSSLGTAAYLNVGTSANNIVQLNGSGFLPALNGSLLTNLPVTTPGGSSGYIQYNNAGAFGASGVYWDSVNSRVGIGTASPGFALSVSGVSDSQLSINGDSGQYVSFYFTYGGSARKGQFFYDNTNAIMGFGGAAANVGVKVFYGNGTTAMTILGTNGNVGIGTTSPSQKLDVNGSINVATALIVPVVRPASDSTTAWKITKADGTTAVVTVDTTGGNVNISTGGYLYGDTTTPYLRLNNAGGTEIAYGSGCRIYLGGPIFYYTNSTLRYSCESSGGITIGSGRSSAGYGSGYLFVEDTCVVGTHAPTARLDVAASTTSRASLRIRSGTAPTSPNDGDIWFDGTNYKCRIGGVTKTFTVT